MSVEEVLSDQDSEDEVDDDVADIEDRRVSWIIFVVINCQFINVKLLLVIAVEVWTGKLF